MRLTNDRKGQEGADEDGKMSGLQDEFAGTYEEMILDGRRFLCQIPRVETDEKNHTAGADDARSQEEKERELARATDRGLELLREMEGKCMYYVSGWWSYSFCYKNQVKQFHALPSGSGVPSYPPMEDPTTHSFVLGRFPQEDEEEQGAQGEEKERKSSTDVAELQTKGESRYLVQRLGGGTKCDLTGKDRKIEVQFHCHPQSTDRIGWIKELATCTYLMVIYTPRLCHDVAFLPPQENDVHGIECREILTPDEVPDWEAAHEYVTAQRLVESATPEFPVVGGIEVGAKKLVGTEGRQIEKGRVASAGEEKVEVVARSENGEVKRLSREELKKFDLDPEKIETLRRRLEELANGKDWKLEVVEANGERGLRGIVDADDDYEEDASGYLKTEERKREEEKERKKQEAKRKKSKEPEEKKPKQPERAEEQEPAEYSEEGSEEIFKEEL